jgi:hypothetical protein
LATATEGALIDSSIGLGSDDNLHEITAIDTFEKVMTGGFAERLEIGGGIRIGYQNLNLCPGRESANRFVGTQYRQRTLQAFQIEFHHSVTHNNSSTRNHPINLGRYPTRAEQSPHQRMAHSSIILIFDSPGSDCSFKFFH